MRKVYEITVAKDYHRPYLVITNLRNRWYQGLVRYEGVWVVLLDKYWARHAKG